MTAESLPTPWRWNRHEFVKSATQGLFGEDARVELLDGEVFFKVGQGNAHIYSLSAITEALRLAYGAGFVVRQQMPIPAGEYSQPEPDVSVLVGSPSRYDGRDPTIEEIALIVEVADTSLTQDRGQKLKVYASAGIQEYWILNIADRRLEVYRRPLAQIGAYGDTLLFLEGSNASPLRGTESTISVSELLPNNRGLELPE